MSSKYLNGMDKARVDLNETSVADWRTRAKYLDAKGQACFGPEGGTLRVWRDGYVDIFNGQIARYDKVPHVMGADEKAEADPSLYTLLPIHQAGATEAFFGLWLSVNAEKLACLAECAADEDFDSQVDDLYDDVLDCIYDCNDERLCADEDGIVGVA